MNTARLAGRALLVEDNHIIALAAEEMLVRLGAAAVDVASSVAEAMAFMDQALPNFALLDVNLAAETSFPVAERLHAVGVPFAFATGYATICSCPSRSLG
jgi:CheY-like chemotaxis protein